MGIAAEPQRGRARFRLCGVVGLGVLALACLSGEAPAAKVLLATPSSAKVTEGGKAVFTVKLSAPAKKKLAIGYRTYPGTAKAPADYKSVIGKLVFKRGQKLRKVSIPTKTDALAEGVEQFTLKLTAPTGVRLKKRVVTATLLDANPPPALSIADLGASEGNAGSSQAVLTVTLSTPATTTIGVSWATVAVGATVGSDYTTAGGSLSFAPGQTSKQVNVPVLGDTVDEDDETLEVRLSAPAGNTTIGDDRAVLTIQDDDPAVADVGVTLSDAPDPVIAGAPLTYTATVTNYGSDRAPQTVLTDVLPAGFAFVSASASAGSCNHAAGTVTCQLGMIPNGGTRTVTIVAEPGVAGSIQNTVSVAGAYTDGTAANDSASATTQVSTGADVSVDLTASASQLLAGQNLTYSLAVANRGPFPAADPVVTDTLPAGVTFISASPGCLHSAGTVTCGAAALGASMAPGANVPLQIVVTRSDAVDASLVNQASISTSGPSDPDAANNTDSTTTPYHAAGDLHVTMTNSGEPLDIGEDLSFTITLQNLGPNPSASVSLHDSLPAGFTLETTTPSQGLCTPSVSAVDCTFGTLASGATVTVVLAGRPAASAMGTQLTNSASATSATADPNSSDNAASSTAKVQPKASINDTSVNEPIGLFPLAGIPRTALVTFTVTLSNASPQTITLGWTTADGTALAPGDYTSNAGWIQFAPGQTSQQVQMVVVSDGAFDLAEPNETLFVNLTTPVNATVLDGQGVCTILD